MTYPVLDVTRTEDDRVLIEIPTVLDAPVGYRFVLNHGRDTLDPHVRAFTADGEARGVAYLRVIDAARIEVTVSDDVAYVEVSP